MGFNAIAKRMKKIRPKLLSIRLRAFEQKGLITKTVYSDKPVRTSYFLTQKGKDLYEIAVSLKKWNAKNTPCYLNCDKKRCVDCDLY